MSPAAGMLLRGLIHVAVLCAVLLPSTSCVTHNSSAAPGPEEHLVKGLQGSHEKIVGPLQYNVTNNTMDYNVHLDIGRDRKGSTTWTLCTGTLLTPLVVLTNAYCVAGMAPEKPEVSRIHVLVGAYDVGSVAGRKQGHYQELRYPRIEIPEGFYSPINGPVYEVDWAWNIAIVKLDTPVPSDRVSTYPRWQGVKDLVLGFGSPVKIVGWGMADNIALGKYPAWLRGLNTHTTNCTIDPADQITETSDWQQERLEKAGRELDGEWNRGAAKFICIEPKDTVGGPCIGDWGGPLLAMPPRSSAQQQPVLVGVLSLLYNPGLLEKSCLTPSVTKVAYVNLASGEIHQWLVEAVKSVSPGGDHDADDP